MTEPAAPFPALPRTHILSYVTTTNTPTHLRDLTARMLTLIAAIHLAIAIIAFGVLLCFVVVAVLNPDPRAATMLDHLTRISGRQGWRLQFAGFVYALTVGATLWGCATPVRDGHKAACYIAKAVLVPFLFVLAVLAAVSSFPAIIWGLGLGLQPAQPAFLVFFILTASLALVMLLVCDLASFLSWIGKHPVAEKPPTPFL